MKNLAVVIPFFNRESTLKRAVDSVLGQTYQDFDLYLVDDASTDDSLKLAQEYQASFPTKVFLECLPKNLGVSAARNIVLKKKDYQYFALLDSDDEWLPTKLEKQFLALSDSGLKICHTEEIWIRNNVRVNQHKKHKKHGGRIFEHCLEMCKMSPSSIVFHKDLLDEHGYFREDFPVCEDFDLWLKFSSTHEVVFLEEPLINKYGGHEDQLSRKFHSMDIYRLKSLLEQKDNPHISQREAKLLSEVFWKKWEILKLGGEKHNNGDLLNSLKVLQKDFSFHSQIGNK